MSAWPADEVVLLRGRDGEGEGGGRTDNARGKCGEGGESHGGRRLVETRKLV